MRSRYLIAVAALFVVTLSTANAKTRTFHLDETYNIEKDGTLYLYSNDADVLITGSDRDDVHVVVDYAENVSGLGIKTSDHEFEVIVTEENGNLRIREMDSDRSYAGIFVSMDVEYSITIQAPSSVALQIVGEDDEYMIDGFTSGIRLRMEDGRARLRKMSGDSFEFELEDGDVEMTGGAGLLDVSLEDGSFTVDEAAFTSATGDVEDGRIRIETTLADDGSYRFHGEDGDISIKVLGGGGEFSVYYEDGHVRASSAFDEAEEDDNFSLFTLPGGTAKVRFRMEDGRVSLRSK